MTKRLTDRFPSAYLKLQWAKRHLEQLDSLSDAYLRERLKLTVGRDFLGQLVMRVKQEHALPANFGLMIGDVATNLRATLDHIVWYLVFPHLTSEDREESVAFPFSKNEGRLKSNIEKAMIERAGPAASKIIRDIKPYPGGDDILCGLNTLANRDKHRIVAIVSDHVQLHGIRTKTGDARKPIKFENLRMGRGPGLTHSIHISGMAVKVSSNGSVDHDQFDMTFHIVFSEGQPFSGLSVVPTLRTLAQKVEEILTKFDTAYPSQFAPGHFAEHAWSAR